MATYASYPTRPSNSSCPFLPHPKPRTNAHTQQLSVCLNYPCTSPFVPWSAWWRASVWSVCLATQPCHHLCRMPCLAGGLYTLTGVSGRAVSIGTYLARLGRHCVLKTDQPIVLTVLHHT
ncbi:hypothetical protein Vretimale_18453 [Volvox reticuliferus]|uniref:Uncharacterized protein n=1 Tax=Volvox reticuliferus TaxID=1737510 RepID=A0A8J4GX68_9CHLO|nr:hypothetical protein Vretifemale_19823 [Volvox reticuliferus]GIM15710.1 hypothetical protein Vretimale_18453 [Volvox reticuliferus]